MQPETSNLVAAIEKQTALFRELEVALQASRTAYKARNLELIYIHLDSQTTLCARLRELQAEAARAAQGESVSSLSRPDRLPTELREALAVLAQAQQNVRRLNAEQQAFVAGSLRTLRVMSNALSNCYPTYTQANVPFFVSFVEAHI